MAEKKTDISLVHVERKHRGGERERDQVANHFSPSNYDKASLSRAHSRSRMAGPQPEDILVPANTTIQVKKLENVSVESNPNLNTTGPCVTESHPERSAMKPVRV